MSDSPGQVESAIFSSMPTLPHDLQVRPAGPADRPRLLQWILSHDTEMQFEDPLVRELLARHQRGLLSLELLLQADSGGKNVDATFSCFSLYPAIDPVFPDDRDHPGRQPAS